jgi:nucleotidyltransferase substrate binding protein (TIGR01987 family)
MEKIKLLFDDLRKASKKLSEASAQDGTDMNRDATIQRFEFTFELAWKLFQAILAAEGIESYGPRNAIREAGKLGLIDDVEKWLEFLTARNLATHTYNEKLAGKVYGESKIFLDKLSKVLNAVDKYLASRDS